MRRLWILVFVVLSFPFTITFLLRSTERWRARLPMTLVPVSPETNQAAPWQAALSSNQQESVSYASITSDQQRPSGNTSSFLDAANMGISLKVSNHAQDNISNNGSSFTLPRLSSTSQVDAYALLTVGKINFTNSSVLTTAIPQDFSAFSPYDEECGDSYMHANGILSNWADCPGTVAPGYCILRKREAKALCDTSSTCAGVGEPSPTAGWSEYYGLHFQLGTSPIRPSADWKACLKAGINVEFLNATEVPTDSATFTASDSVSTMSAATYSRDRRRRRRRKANEMTLRSDSLPQCFYNNGFPWMANGTTNDLAGKWVRVNSLREAYGIEIESKCPKPNETLNAAFLEDYVSIFDDVWSNPPCHTDWNRRPIRWTVPKEVFEPNECNLRQITTEEFIQTIAGRTLLILGDSIAKQNFRVLMCQLVRHVVAFEGGESHYWFQYTLFNDARIVFEASNDLGANGKDAKRYLDAIRANQPLVSQGGLRLRQQDILLLNGLMHAKKHWKDPNIWNAYIDFACEAHRCWDRGQNCPAVLWQQTSSNHFTGDGTGRYRDNGLKKDCLARNTEPNPDRIFEAEKIANCGVRMLPSNLAEASKGLETRMRSKYAGSHTVDCMHYCTPGVPNHITRILFNAIVHGKILSSF